jgi:hypothetical protein
MKKYAIPSPLSADLTIIFKIISDYSASITPFMI